MTKISIIDAALATQLGTLGVSRYNQIAAWRKADVETISQGLGFKGRIEQENWIEQAQILAGGGETFYSARRAKVGAPAPAALAPSPAAVAQTPVTVASPVVLPLTMGAAAVAPATSPKVEERAAFAQSAGTARPQPTLAVPPDRTVVMPAAISTAVPATVAAAVASVATASAIPAAAAMRPPMAPVRDSLQRIGAVNGEIEKLLTGQGVTRYSQIAGWSSNEIERFDRLLGSQGRIARENWVEQAQILAKGGDTAHSREYDRRNVDSTREQVPARPKSITEAIKANAGAVAAGVGSAVSSRADIGGLRSVRSDAYKTANDAATAAAAAAAAGIGSAKVVRSAEIDDLKRIRGIGVLIEKRLNSVGIVSYGQIADWTTVDIDRVSASLDFKGRIERENWVEQARILSAGGQTEFSRRVDRGEVETSKPKS